MIPSGPRCRSASIAGPSSMSLAGYSNTLKPDTSHRFGTPERVNWVMTASLAVTLSLHGTGNGVCVRGVSTFIPGWCVSVCADPGNDTTTAHQMLPRPRESAWNALKGALCRNCFRGASNPGLRSALRRAWVAQNYAGMCRIPLRPSWPSTRKGAVRDEISQNAGSCRPGRSPGRHRVCREQGRQGQRGC